MKELFTGLLLIVGVFIAPVVALGWIVYRMLRGGKGNDYSIK